MGADVMGRVVVEATVENIDDLVLARNGHIAETEVRSINVSNALVDTGATMLALPKRLIDELGLYSFYEKEAMSSRGLGKVNVFGPVRLTIQDRTCNVDVVQLPDEVPALIGQVPLELMDWVVDPKNQRLIGNPAHGGEQIIELY
jgi:predicted aspartyl protease